MNELMLCCTAEGHAHDDAVVPDDDGAMLRGLSALPCWQWQLLMSGTTWHV